MSFWDIDAYLAEQEQVQFCFVEDAQGMGFLDSSKGIQGTVPAQSPLHAPMWALSTIHTYVYKSSGEIVRIDVPKIYDKTLQGSYFSSHEGQKGAKLEDINLRQKSQFYFQVYQNLQKILQNNPDLISKQQIKNIYSCRGSNIINRASTHQEQAKAETKFQNYTQRQRFLYRVIRAKTKQYEQWQCKKQ